MPKSKNRKNHKKKVAARKKRLEEKRRVLKQRLQTQFNEELAKQMAKKQVDSDGEKNI